ncbi:hypothetical protein ACFQRB_19235 [Halobaculum litoreum]|uniref:Uncharacterized protein n=1 Tax=Halobaculum litoreum TaxID=3031998 RepID=A0ABD5XWX2_9EURY
MPSRRLALVLGGLLLLSGVSVAAGEVIDAPPTASFSNEDGRTYEVTIFTVPDHRTALLTNVGVTTADGERRLVTVSDLVWSREYRDASVADPGVETTTLTVEPGETVETTVSSWEPGELTVILIEERAGAATTIRADAVTCTQRQQEYSRTFETGGSSGSSVCASNLDWLGV